MDDWAFQKQKLLLAIQWFERTKFDIHVVLGWKKNVIPEGHLASSTATIFVCFPFSSSLDGSVKKVKWGTVTGRQSILESFKKDHQ